MTVKVSEYANFTMQYLVDHPGATMDEANAAWDQEKPKSHAQGGTPPDTSLCLGGDRKAWLRKKGGIQPTIIRMIDEAMGKY